MYPGITCAKTRATNPEDWADFLRRKRDEETWNHRAGRDELTSAIYSNPAPVSPSGLTTTMPSQSYPQPQPHYWHPGIQSSLSNIATSDFCLRCGIPRLVWSSKLMGTLAQGCMISRNPQRKSWGCRRQS